MFQVTTTLLSLIILSLYLNLVNMIEIVVDWSIVWYLEYDYDDITYPIPFNQLYNSIDSRYVNFGKDHDLPSFVLTGSILSFSVQASDVLLMTGATDNHALGSFNCMYSMILVNPYATRPPSIAAIGKAKNWHRHCVIRIADYRNYLMLLLSVIDCLQTTFFNSIVFRNQCRSFFFKIIIFTQVVSQESQSSTFLTTSGILLNSQ